MSTKPEDHDDECPLCGGTGEVSISKDGTHEGTDYYGCPVCISRERDEEESRLRKANLDCVEHFNAIKAERDELVAALKQARRHVFLKAKTPEDFAFHAELSAAVAKARA